MISRYIHIAIVCSLCLLTGCKEKGEERTPEKEKTAPIFERPIQTISRNENLEALAWLEGNWVDMDEDVDIRIKTRWNRTGNLLIQSFVMKELNGDNGDPLEGEQIIAWDSSKKQIRSWIFDSDGGFGEGVWKKDGDRWYMTLSYVLADGRKASATNIYRKMDDNSYTWASIDRDVDGEVLPSIDPVTVVREESKSHES